MGIGRVKKGSLTSVVVLRETRDVGLPSLSDYGGLQPPLLVLRPVVAHRKWPLPGLEFVLGELYKQCSIPWFAELYYSGASVGMRALRCGFRASTQ